MNEFEVIKVLKTVEQTGDNFTKEIRLVKWKRNGKIKVDFRVWKKVDDSEIPCKGISFDLKDVPDLIEALQEIEFEG